MKIPFFLKHLSVFICVFPAGLWQWSQPEQVYVFPACLSPVSPRFARSLLTPTGCFHFLLCEVNTIKAGKSWEFRSSWQTCTRLANRQNHNPELAALAVDFLPASLSVLRPNPSGLLSLQHCNIICIFWFSMPSPPLSCSKSWIWTHLGCFGKPPSLVASLLCRPKHAHKTDAANNQSVAKGWFIAPFLSSISLEGLQTSCCNLQFGFLLYFQWKLIIKKPLRESLKQSLWISHQNC